MTKIEKVELRKHLRDALKNREILVQAIQKAQRDLTNADVYIKHVKQILEQK